MITVKDQLQSISGDLLGARVALDSEWIAILTSKEKFQGTKIRQAILALASAQRKIEDARKFLQEA